MRFLITFNLAVFIVLTCLYFYQAIYAVLVLLRKNKPSTNEKPVKLHKYGVIIAARNESAVIGQLIQSIKNQTYPSALIDIFVVADNCTDDTAEKAEEAGAIVERRFHTKQIGKGYALDYMFKKIHTYYGNDAYDGYFIFDADNLLDENYIAEMNRVFDSGYRIVTSYRNSKNYGTNWITAGYSLWFLREAKYLNNARMMLHSSCAVSGTGFLLSSAIIRKNRGWKYHLLTEDIEFSVDTVIQGEKIGYCGSAIIYDEQPATFRQSWTQRLRWSKGFYQVMRHYGAKLFCSMFRKNCNFLSCYDMFMTIAPATIVSIFCFAVNACILGEAYITAQTSYSIYFQYYFQAILPEATSAMAFCFINCYFVLFAMGLLTTITEWKQIKCKSGKKLLYTLTFPLFIMTYIPISIAALFRKVEWKPITHTVVKSLDEVR